MKAAGVGAADITGDGLPDDRVRCETCRHLSGFRCIEKRQGVLTELPRRCQQYLPIKSEADRRTGMERWPSLQQQIAEARAADNGAGKA
jgi:hypothetical protein